LCRNLGKEKPPGWPLSWWPRTVAAAGARTKEGSLGHQAVSHHRHAIGRRRVGIDPQSYALHLYCDCGRWEASCTFCGYVIAEAKSLISLREARSGLKMGLVAR
jgi:hypothetical protein